MNKIKKLVLVMMSMVMVLVTACGKDNTPKNALGDESYRIIKLMEMSGEVNYTRDNKEQAAYLNMNFENGDSVITGVESAATITLDEDKRLVMGADTSLTMVAEGDKENSRTIITLDKGEIMNSINEKLSPESMYEIKTSNATIGVQGTIFYVKADGDETIVYCEEGVVAVETDDAEAAVTAGQAVKIEAEDIVNMTQEELENEMSPDILSTLEAIVGESTGDILPDGAVLEADGYYWVRHDDGSWIKYGADGNVVEGKGYSQGLNGERQYILYKYTTDEQGFNYAYQEDVYDLDTDAFVASYTDHYDFVEERVVDAAEPTGVVRKLWYTHYFEEDKGDGDIFISDTQEVTIRLWDHGGWTVSSDGWN